MRYVIPTIQHTGTKFLYKLFPEGYTHCSLIEDIDQDNVLYVGHLTANSVDRIKELPYPMLIPLRHPYLVAESWVRRGKPLSELADNFRLLVNELDPLNPLYLPIDVDNRQDYLDKINKDLGLSLSTNWNVENSKETTYNLSHKDLTPEPIMVDLVEDIEGFIKRFY